MTVAAGYRVPSVGAVLVADGRVTHDGEIISDSETKLVVCGATVVAVAGTIGPCWRKLQAQPPKSYAAFLKAVDEFEEADVDWLAYDRSTGRLWLGDVRITSPFATLGSGSSLALGALEALPIAKSLLEAEKAAVKAVQVACRRNATCGGKVRVAVVKGLRAPVEFR